LSYPRVIGKVWVLDTETKGTGAEMVPLEKLLREREREPLSLPLLRRRKRRAAREPEPSPPRTFKVVDVITGRTLAEAVDARSVLGLLEETASIVDAHRRDCARVGLKAPRSRVSGTVAAAPER
jgi:hypothetical protein